MAGFLNVTTGSMGLAVCESPYTRLRTSYRKILNVLQKIPRNVVYRKYTEQIINEKLDSCKSEPDVKKLGD